MTKDHAAEAAAKYGQISGATSILHEVARNAVLTSRLTIDETPFRVSMDGHPIGSIRLRAIVNEGDRLRLCSISRIVPEDVVTGFERIVSASGACRGVRILTDVGAIEFETAPGMRPGRRR